ncbi:MAG: hypothetical protein E6J90_35025 [Deltaproteobacteria bacterium]|nr:MAG: hypothetical protein E6J90_35025 [Deltaproteobacteria bacterium]
MITAGSVYILGFHEERGKRFVIMRGLPGTDREHVVIRDSDPRIGEASMFELPPDRWAGKVMEIATMTSSEVTTVVVETDPAAIALVGGNGPSARPAGWAPQPPGLPERPRVAGVLGRGTSPALGATAPRGVGYNVVVGQTQAGAGPVGEPEVPYPRRHVQYAENAAAFLRSIARRDRLFEDVAGERDLAARLHKALEDCAALLAQIRSRGQR